MFAGNWEKGPVNTRRCDLEPLVRSFHLARSCVGILRYWYSTASLSWCSRYCYDNHIVIYNSLSGSGSLMRQLCCGWREFLVTQAEEPVSGLGRFVCAPSSWDHSESGHVAWLQLILVTTSAFSLCGEEKTFCGREGVSESCESPIVSANCTPSSFHGCSIGNEEFLM